MFGEFPSSGTISEPALNNAELIRKSLIGVSDALLDWAVECKQGQGVLR